MQNEQMRKIRLGELLIQSGFMTNAQLEEALAYQKSAGTGEKIGDILIAKGFITEDDFVNAFHQQLDLPIMDLSRYRVNSAACAVVPQSIAEKYLALPVECDESTITVAMYNPADYYAIEEIELVSRRRVKTMVAKRSSIRIALERAYTSSISLDLIGSANKEKIADAPLFDEEATERINSAPIVQLVDAMLVQAIKMRASDIHIDPMPERVRVRFRVDGELLEIMTLNPTVHNSLVTRIKIMGNIDIAEKRLPQDGRFTSLVSGNETHARVATMPTLYGEKIVIRLLGDANKDVPDVRQLGMNAQNQQLFARLLDVPSGIVLITGPTGSGKTTTLYSALRKLAKPGVNVVSIEDPVEKAIDGVNQMPINIKAGITFASGLRALLRQDPDIIMIGEIRDRETAEIAARAAITGHLVLSTIHTNDAASTFARIIDMGVEPFVAASAMQGAVSQRLVRLLCSRCKQEHFITKEEHDLTPELAVGERVYRQTGCIHCNNTGYYGRTAVHEIISVTSTIRSMIARNIQSDEIRAFASEKGSQSLRDNALELVRAGTTSVSELLRITFSLD